MAMPGLNPNRNNHRNGFLIFPKIAAPYFTTAPMLHYIYTSGNITLFPGASLCRWIKFRCRSY